ncbi:CG9389 [Drosophila busckii]|uniref:inositol-phosphate phosphatase n=1 Tax=Drosophila busckii TaxID=30019 RepID=A0A0M4EHT2_DROBS|nr:uncharacterized protein LOC108599999 [Drosophila busckii]ALC44190.1 CG9389 [Drosophila busckii]
MAEQKDGKNAEPAPDSTDTPPGPEEQQATQQNAHASDQRNTPAHSTTRDLLAVDSKSTQRTRDDTPKRSRSTILIAPEVAPPVPPPSQPKNAATEFGLEDHTANSQDPRVSQMRGSSKTAITARKSEPHEHAGAATPKAYVDTPVTPPPTPPATPISTPPTSPTTTAESAPIVVPPIPLMIPAANDNKKNNDKSTNTDVTFDPSKEYAWKTTNTSGLMYTDTDEPAEQLNLAECLAFIVGVVKTAGAFALVANKNQQEYTTKQHKRDLLTRTDNEVEEMIIKAICERYPQHKFIAEERVSRTSSKQVVLTDEPTWIIDPIDGTMNYVHHFPYYCISVALLIDKTTVLGVVYNPPLQECYTARKGHGAALNDQRMCTSGQCELSEAMILQEYTSETNDDRAEVSVENTNRLSKKVHALRSIGSSAMGLAMVASGVVDGFYHFGLHVWDMAAGNLLVTEAGGTVIDPAGGQVDIMSRRVLAAATFPLAMALSAELTQSYPKPRDDEAQASSSRKESKPKQDFTGQTEFSDDSFSVSSENSRLSEFETQKPKPS